ncbi:MAG: CPBP family intramembrane metalloprotease [candidate division KSB1 bacterium]|nr:CPBP family intramembrane metalloprotease [candidate division KSB1 bacterium]
MGKSNRSKIGYWRSTRQPLYGFLAVVPLILFYEIIALTLNQNQTLGIRNGADVLLKQTLATLGIHGPVAYSAILMVLLGLIYWRQQKTLHIRVRPLFFVFMFLESLFYAAFLGMAVAGLTNVVISRLSLMQPNLELDLLSKIMLALGAGVYEELFFRVLIISVLYLLMTKVMGINRIVSYIVAALIASVLFSAFHYIGPLGDTFEFYTFIFRFLAGLIFSILYILRGFGIVAYTHALYDLLLILR